MKPMDTENKAYKSGYGSVALTDQEMHAAPQKEDRNRLF